MCDATPPKEHVLEAPGPFGPLKGIHTITGDASDPVVLLIPGSGPTDRDGNSPLGLAASTYKLLAHELASQGIQSVRIDKRGLFSSHAAIENPNQVTIEAYVRDIHCWLEVIRQKLGKRSVWLTGHSEGGLIALTAAQRTEGIKGVILMATPAETFGTILRHQLKANAANASLLDEAFSIISGLEAGIRVDVSKMHPILQKLFHPEVQDYLMNLMSVDPKLLIKGLELPILILQGSRDIQVGVEDAKALQNANSASILKLLPDVNHVFKRVNSDDRSENLAAYNDPSLPLADGVSSAITAFITREQQ